MRLILILSLSLVFALVSRAQAQCGLQLTTVHGGDTTALAYVDTNTLIVARGLTLELMRSTGIDAVPVVIATARLESPVKKISMSFGSGRAFVLMEDGRITVMQVTIIGQVVNFQRGETVGSGLDEFIDIVAAGSRVHAVERSTFFTGPVTQVTESTLKFYDFDTSPPTLLSTMTALSPDYRFDRAVRIGNRLWAGFHSLNSNVYGVDGIDYSVPTAPVRAGTALNFINLNNGSTEVTAMAAIGANLFLSFRDSGEDWLRAADTSNPQSVIWRTPVDLNSIAEHIAVVGSLLHVAVGGAGISTWNAANPAALSWLGTTAISAGEVHDAVGIAGTLYTAAGHAGFRTLNSAVPAAMTTRSAVLSQPTDPIAIRQQGVNSITLDDSGRLLRISNFSLTGTAQTISTLPILQASFLELSIQPGGQYAVLGSYPSASATIQVVDFGNPAAPILRSTTSISTNSIIAMSCFGTRLYVADSQNVFYIIDLSNPASPVIRRSLPLATTPRIRSIASWANAAALAWETRGVALFDTTSATSPVLAATWNPVASYNALGLIKGPNALYIGSRVPAQMPMFTVPRLEAIDVASISSPTSLWSRTDPDASSLLDIERLTHVVSGPDQLLVTTGPYFDGQAAVRIFDVTNPAGAPQVALRLVWNAYTAAAAASSGSKLLFAAATGGIVELATPTQWAPAFASQPTNQNPCLGQSVTFSLAAPGVSARPAATFRWQRNSIPLSDGPTPWGSVIAGANTPTLSVIAARLGDAALYTLVAENACGLEISLPAELDFPCPADFNCSGTVDVPDIFAFLSAWFAPNQLADFDGNALVDVPDIFAFLDAWFAGC